MTADVQLGNETVRMCGNAATAYRYQSIFHKDLLMALKGMNENNFDENVLKGLAFTMALQARGADWKQVTGDDFVTWLEQFEEVDFLSKAQEIMNVWIANAQSMVKAKKK